MILQEDGANDLGYYKTLLDMKSERAFVVLIQFGMPGDEGILTTPVGMSVKAQAFYPECRNICKEFFHCIVGPIMTNRIVLVVPCGADRGHAGIWRADPDHRAGQKSDEKAWKGI